MTFIQPILPKNSGSLECLSKAKQWLNSCENSHPECRRDNDSAYPLPTRVIRVGDDNTHPTLSETQGERGRWITLSYCWGNSKRVILDEITKPSLMQGVPLDSFPATIRDAIVVARALGVQYIWIDALCIMQDSREDWEREAPKMSQIYTLAVLTIINAEGSCADSGIFCDRTEFGVGEHGAPSCYLPWSNSQDDIGPSPEYIALHHVVRYKRTFAGPTGDKQVWASRGWTLQEDLLSWRTLTFMKSEMIWGCPSMQTWECGQYRAATVDGSREYATESVRRVKPNLGLVKVSQVEQTTMSRRPSEPFGLLTLRTPEIYRSWYSMVEEYSKRQLSFDKDKLVAIVGIAKEVQAYIPDRYCAGLWEHDLIAGLIWDYDGESWYYPVGKPLEPNSDSGLPSWSWTSINDEVFFRFKEQSSKAKLGEPDKFRELAQVEELKIRHISSNSYGPISSCELTLTAPSYQCRTIPQDDLQTVLPIHRILFDRLKHDSEYNARHKERPNQKMVFQQLAWVEDFRIVHYDNRRRIPFPACAILVLESIEAQSEDTPGEIKLPLFSGDCVGGVADPSNPSSLHIISTLRKFAQYVRKNLQPFFMWCIKLYGSFKKRREVGTDEERAPLQAQARDYHSLGRHDSVCQDERYRRVSLLSFGYEGMDMTPFQIPAWPIKTVRIV